MNAREQRLQAPLDPRPIWETLGFLLLDWAVWALKRAGYFHVEGRAR